jgi:hypothetical protein
MKPNSRTRAQSRAPGNPIQKLIEERGGVAQFARDLSRVCGYAVPWATVNNWKLRGAVSKGMVLHVHPLTRAPLTDLLR